MKSRPACSKCGGEYVEKTGPFNITPSYLDFKLSFSYEGKYLECQECGNDPVPADLAKYNDRQHEIERLEALVKYIHKLEAKVDELEATIERLCEAAEFDVEDWLERHDG